MSYKADVSSVSPSSEQRANLHFQLSWYNEITLLPPPTQHHSFFRNFHPIYLILLDGAGVSRVLYVMLSNHWKNI